MGYHQPPIKWVPEPISPRTKRPEGEAEFSPPTSTDVYNAYSFTSTLILVQKFTTRGRSMCFMWQSTCIIVYCINPYDEK